MSKELWGVLGSIQHSGEVEVKNTTRFLDSLCCTKYAPTAC